MFRFLSDAHMSSFDILTLEIKKIRTWHFKKMCVHAETGTTQLTNRMYDIIQQDGIINRFIVCLYLDIF